jgi:hypothetical protein
MTATSEGEKINGASNTSPTVHEAGVNFDFEVTAYNSMYDESKDDNSGHITANYVPNDIQLLVKRAGPTTVDAVDGEFIYGPGFIESNLSPVFQSVTLATFNSGISATNNASFPEVGILNLGLQDIGYGYSENIIKSDAINIGRFIPDHFEQTVVEQGSFDAVCNQNTSFVYTGQVLVSDATKGAVSYLVNPVVELTAKNAQNDTTQNYTETGYMKLDAAANFIVPPTTDSTITGKGNTNLLPLTARIHTGTVSHDDLVSSNEDTFGLPLLNGVLHYELSGDDNFVYTRDENSEVNAQDNDIDFVIDQINFVDSDGVSIEAPVNITGTAGINLRFGRANLANSFGPETADLPQPLSIQYLNASGKYVINDQDSCTNFDSSKMSHTSGTLNENLTVVNTIAGHLDNGETREMLLTAPGAGEQGTVDVEYDIYSWLKYDWNWDGVTAKEFSENPDAVATFGQFRGNDRIIYQREVNN